MGWVWPWRLLGRALGSPLLSLAIAGWQDPVSTGPSNVTQPVPSLLDLKWSWLALSLNKSPGQSYPRQPHRWVQGNSRYTIHTNWEVTGDPWSCMVNPSPACVRAMQFTMTKHKWKDSFVPIAGQMNKHFVLVPHFLRKEENPTVCNNRQPWVSGRWLRAGKQGGTSTAPKGFPT
jgi:hypothetical protein